MSTGSHRHILGGNLTGSSGAVRQIQQKLYTCRMTHMTHRVGTGLYDTARAILLAISS